MSLKFVNVFILVILLTKHYKNDDVAIKYMMWHLSSSDILEHKTIQGHPSLQPTLTLSLSFFMNLNSKPLCTE